jgi:hypothetical protein
MGMAKTLNTSVKSSIINAKSIPLQLK